TSSVGDVEVRLPMDATGDVTITTDIGNASLAAPGTGRWAVNAASEMGEVRTDPDLTRADGTIRGNLTLRASAGDVTLTQGSQRGKRGRSGRSRSAPSSHDRG